MCLEVSVGKEKAGVQKERTGLVVITTIVFIHIRFFEESVVPVIPKSLFATYMEAYRTFGPQQTATNHFCRRRETAREDSDSFL